MFEDYFILLGEVIDDKSIFNFVEAIYSNDRLNSFSAYARTAAYCAARMKDAVLNEVETLKVQADGKSHYFDWIVPRAWDPVKGRLHLRTSGKDGEAVSRGEKTVLHAEVVAKSYDGGVYTVSGLIKGMDSKNREILLCGHLYETGPMIMPPAVD
jgi:hypothetical protein